MLEQSLQGLRIIVVDSLACAVDIANTYAPEHLILEIRRQSTWLPQIASTAGAVFLGDWSPESVGDYCSGPNHTLPTYGYARAYSGLSLEDFQRRMTVQELTPAGLKMLGPTAATLAALEGLDGHAASVAVRLEERCNESCAVAGAPGDCDAKAVCRMRPWLPALTRLHA